MKSLNGVIYKLSQNFIKSLPRVKTPYYLLDENKLHNNYYNLKNAFENQWANFILGYSFKTNSLPWLLNWMKDNGAFAEVVSDKEYELALKLGYSPEKIILNGPYKGEEILRYSLDNGSIVNLDSFSEIQWIKNNKPTNKEKWKIGLRINFDLEKHCPKETIMGEEVGRFGFNLENHSFEKAVKELEDIDYVEIVGIHAHHSTKTKSLNVFRTICEKICEASKSIKNQLEYVDVGGCLFGDKPNAPSLDSYANTIKSALAETFSMEKTTLIMEPGAAIIASPIDFVCRVVDIKDVRDKRIVTTDGSSLNIDPQMHGILFNVEAMSSGENVMKEQVIAGYTCIEKDRMASIKEEKELKKGDILIFRNTGAYSMALSPLFIQYFPSVIVKKEEDYYYAREAWDVDEYLIKSCYKYEKPVGR